MEGPNTVKFEITEGIELSLDNIVCLSGKLKYYPEFDGNYAICTEEKTAKFVVNSEIYKMLSYIAKKDKVSLINLSGTKKVFYSEKFQHIIKILITKKYLNRIA